MTIKIFNALGQTNISSRTISHKYTNVVKQVSLQIWDFCCKIQSDRIEHEDVAEATKISIKPSDHTTENR